MIRIITIALLAMLIGGTARAQQYKVFGHGNQSCGSWTEAKEETNLELIVFTSWLSGYLSAVSVWVETGSGRVNETDIRGAVAWMDNYCRDNPLDSVAGAALNLTFAIKAK